MTELAVLYPDIELTLVKITTEGDRRKNVPVERISTYGVFVKEIQQALLKGRIDLAVHSLKDMPVEKTDGLSLAAVTERLNPGDVLISRGSRLLELSPGATIGTGSLRRSSQLTGCRPDLTVKGIRGNIDTRLRRVSDGEIDGIIIAASALIRLGLESKITEYLPLDKFLPSAGQGALGIEIRSEDRELAELVRPLRHEPTWFCVSAERSFVQALGGGCSAAVASLGEINGDNLRLQGMAASNDGLLCDIEEGEKLRFEQVALRLAQKLLDRGALRNSPEVRES
jgi:hydroxymethylbilane synthase